MNREPNFDENEVLRQCMSSLNEEVPDMPENFHAQWTALVKEDAMKQEETRNSPTAGMPQKNYGGSGYGCAFGTISNFGHSALSVSKINWEPKTFHSV